MREDFLHFVWKNKKFSTAPLLTTDGDFITIFHLGTHNQLAGPDFFNAKIQIGGQLWAGNVEMHLKASDWYAHGHENDANYDNVILHVVWEDDVSVFRKDGTAIPCLVLVPYVPKELVGTHQNLMQKKAFINCEKDFGQVDAFTLANWHERLFIERLEEKSTVILELLEESKNDWEKVLFCLLMKNFGLNRNGMVFMELAKQLDFSIFKKLKNDALKAESMLLGMAGLLADPVDQYQKRLADEFEYLAHKFQLKPHLHQAPNFYGLRPHNFPTLRLSQLANLYAKNVALFQKTIALDGIEAARETFMVAASSYWDTHYVFGKTTTARKKKLSKAFIDLVAINTIIPLKFCHAKKMGNPDVEHLFAFAQSLPAESNAIIKGFNALGGKMESAFQSQAGIQLYNQYCTKNKCLKCVVGNALLLKKG